MILILLGTQNNSFERLLQEVEKLIRDNIINEEVIVQAGNTEYNSNEMKIYDFMPQEKIDNLLKKSNFIITHGGVGSIIGALNKEKKVIAVPRKSQYKEHVNNHQIQIVENFNQEGYIIGIQDVEELKDAVKQIEKFEPKKYKSNNNKLIKIIEDYIN